MTVSLGVLKAGAIRFEPVLPQTKRRAIDDLAMGLLNKVWLTFPEVFWKQDKDIDLIQYAGEQKAVLRNGTTFISIPVNRYCWRLMLHIMRTNWNSSQMMPLQKMQ